MDQWSRAHMYIKMRISNLYRGLRNQELAPKSLKKKKKKKKKGSVTVSAPHPTTPWPDSDEIPDFLHVDAPEKKNMKNTYYIIMHATGLTFRLEMQVGQTRSRNNSINFDSKSCVVNLHQEPGPAIPDMHLVWTGNHIHICLLEL